MNIEEFDDIVRYIVVGASGGTALGASQVGILSTLIGINMMILCYLIRKRERVDNSIG